MESTYNGIHQVTIQLMPCGALYRSECRLLVQWDKGEGQILGLALA